MTMAQLFYAKHPRRLERDRPRRRKAARKPRPILFEPLEPRLLMSASIESPLLLDIAPTVEYELAASETCLPSAPSAAVGSVVMDTAAEPPLGAQSALTLGGDPAIRVAVHAGGFGGHVVAQLNDDTHFDFDAVAVAGNQIDTVGELDAYDAVVIGDLTLESELSAFAPALRAWVEAGGGVVGTGGLIYSAGTGSGPPVADIDAIIPVNTSALYRTHGGPTVTVGNTTHPVTLGVPSFAAGDFLESSPGGADPGGTLLATANNEAAVVVGAPALGRSVWLGLFYMSSASGALRVGPADQLLEQAVAWAGRNQLPSSDLEMVSVSAPDTAHFGETIDIAWVVRNIGTDPAPEEWSDRIWLSADTVLNSGDVLLHTEDAGVSPLPEQATYSRTRTVPLPLSPSLAAGTYFILAHTDAFGQQPEASDTNNVGASGAIALSLPPLPDLVVSETVVEGSPGLQSGANVTIHWSDSNAGTAPTTGAWWDSIEVVNSTTNETLLSTSVRYDPSAPGNGPLDVGASVARQHTFRLPDGKRGVGDLRVAVTADATKAIAELNADGTAETNNQADVNAASVLAAYPDLVVSSFTAPSHPLETNRAVFDVTWEVRNDGRGPTPVSQWVDRIILSRNGIAGDSDDVVVGNFPETTPLSADSSYPKTRSVTLGPNLDGSFFLFVKTDATDAVLEFDAGGDSGEGNNLSAPAGIVIVAPYADLVVDGITGPPPSLSGEPIQVGWTVRNQGTGPSDVAAWTDRVRLSDDDVLDGADLILGTFTHIGTLGKDATCSRQETVTLPNGISGDFHLFVETDALNAVFEGALDGNNAGRTLEPFAVSLAPAPNLVVESVSGPTTGQPRERVTVSWTVENRGELEARAPWIDRVFFYPDGIAAGPLLAQVSREVAACRERELHRVGAGPAA